VPARRIRLRHPVDVATSLAPYRHGPYDPTIRLGRQVVWRAMRTPGGPATVHVEVSGLDARAEAWGPGAEPALDAVPDLLGQSDDAEQLVPRDPVVAAAVRRVPGLRMTRTRLVWESVVPAILEQKVTGLEAWRTWTALIRAHGEQAPGPLRLRVPPDPRRVAALPYHAFHPMGLERRRAEALLRAAVLAPRLEEASALPADAARARLQAVPGIGPWTAAEAARTAWGDPDAVSVGDYHVPRLVCWAFTGERTGTDERMLQLLEPYRGQRARVVRLLEAAGGFPERRGPRMASRGIEEM
jgi:3-methyladenine DNA glycosylase/8-oxoguanine DNA glycosylase